MRVIAKKEFDSKSIFVQQKEPLSADEQAKIQRGLDDIKAGRVTRIKDVNNIWESI